MTDPQHPTEGPVQIEYANPNREVDEHAVLTSVLDALRQVDASVRLRILRTVATFYDLGSFPEAAHPTIGGASPVEQTREPTFSVQEDISPKKFMSEKAPRTDIERVACLAYYLTHFRDQPHFKTNDISRLNMEAAQLKLSNATYTLANAAKKGFLAPGPRGMKQISGIGEEFVAALPDRDAAASALAKLRQRRKTLRKNGSAEVAEGDSETNEQ